MNFNELRLGDIVLVVPMRQPARTYHARVEVLIDEKTKVAVRRCINARNGYNIRRQGEAGVPAPRFAGAPKHVWAHEISYVVKREEKAS